MKQTDRIPRDGGAGWPGSSLRDPGEPVAPPGSAKAPTPATRSFTPTTALLLLALLAAGCSSRGPGSTEFRWGGDASGGEPFLIERPGGEPSGFEGELAEYLGKKIGRTPTFVQRTWSGLPQDLQRGDIDAAFNGMEWTAAREDAMASTVPYFAYSLRLIVRKDSPIKGWDDLRHKPGR